MEKSVIYRPILYKKDPHQYRGKKMFIISFESTIVCSVMEVVYDCILIVTTALLL